MKVSLLLIALILSSASCLNWDPVDKVLIAAINKGAFPGASLRVANKTHILYSENYGYLTRQVSPFGLIPVTNDTIFDIASLSKVTGTLGCIEYLADTNRLNVNDLVSKYIPEYSNNGKESTTVKNLLLHNAGLLPDYPGNRPDNKTQVMDWTYSCKLDYPIGTKYVYSDLSFILLGEIAERIMKISLDEFVKMNLNRMGIENTTYNPSSDLIYKIAPTEYSTFRKTLIRGIVHDPTAYAFGGVAGHAGLFSVADDLVRYMQVHLSGGITPDNKLVYNSSTLNQFFKKEENLPYTNTRALGWDTVPIQEHPPCGHYFSANSFGHTGFTGTSMWADRDKNLIIVLLTNRVHPTAADSSQTVVARSDVSDAVVKVLGL